MASSLSSMVIFRSVAMTPVTSKWLVIVSAKTPSASSSIGCSLSDEFRPANSPLTSSASSLCSTGASYAPMSSAIKWRNRPMSLAMAFGTGGNSPTHWGALAWSETGVTSNSDCSGSASMIIHVRPAITNCLRWPSSSSPLSLSERTKASSTFPRLLRVTASLTR